MSPLVSIVIPVHNRAKVFARSLASLIAQSYGSVEIIVVNDGSTEDVESIVKSHPGIVYLEQENKGAPAARNAGAAKAKGEYILFCDADVMAKPQMITTLAQELQAHSEVSYVYATNKFGFKTFPALPFSAERLKTFNYISTMALVRRKDHPGFDESLQRFQDWDVWLTMLAQHKIGRAVPQLLYKTVPGGGMSSWVPGFWYRLFPQSKQALAYARARDIIYTKHNLHKQ